MKKIRSIHLQLWLPLILGLACLVLLLAAFNIQMVDTSNRLRFFATENANELLSRARADINSIAMPQHERSLNDVIKLLAMNADVDNVILTDATGTIINSTRTVWLGHKIEQAVPYYASTSLANVLALHEPQIRVDIQHQQMLGRSLINLPRTGALTSTADTGNLIVLFDLSQRIANVEHLMWQRILWLTPIMLAVILLIYLLARRTILRPATALRRAMTQIGTGDLDTKLNIVGSGEFSELAQAVTGMVTQIKSRDAALAESEERFRQLAEGTFEAIVVHENGFITNANTLAESLIDVPPGALVGRPMLSLIAPHEHATTMAKVQQGFNGIWITDLLDSHGTIIPVEVSVRQHQSAGRSVRVASLRDLRQRNAAEAKVQRLANIDPLTGLANRRLLLEQIAFELSHERVHGQRAALAVINVNSFRSINDSLGMAVGDGVLRTIGLRLSAKMHTGQILARVVADTFAVLFTAINAPSQTEASAQIGRLVEQLLFTLGEPLQVQEQVLHLNANAGVVMLPDSFGDAAELLRKAETAMHAAKQDGPGKLRFFAPKLQKAAHARLELRNDLRKALEVPQEQFCLHYQPQVSADGINLLGVEALLRWQHPKKGLIYPGEFIPEAEASGLIVPLGLWVVEEAIACWQRTHTRLAAAHKGQYFRISVNVSQHQLHEPDFVTRIVKLLQQTGVAATALEMEMTESVLAQDASVTLKKMLMLRKLGIRLALDDFGTGYSSLSYLKQLPINTLKIDRSFITDIDNPKDKATSRRSAALIQAIITMAHQVDVRVLAEGVETDRQHNILVAAGCDAFQGYLISQPLPEAEFQRWLADFYTKPA